MSIIRSFVLASALLGLAATAQAGGLPGMSTQDAPRDWTDIHSEDGELNRDDWTRIYDDDEGE